MAKELIPDRPQEKLKTAFEYQVDSAAGIIRKLEEKVTLALKEPSLIKRQDLHLQAVGAAITLYSPEVANQYLNDTEIQKLADLLKENKKYTINLLPKEKDIYEKLVAKNEAIIKGFPMSFDGVADHITVKVQAKAYKNAVESALIEMSVGDEQIPRKKYGEELLKRVKEKLDKPFYDEVTEETVEISEETISEAEKLIKKANKNIDLQQTTLTSDRVEVQNAFKSTIDKLCKFLEKNIETNKNIKQGIDIIQGAGVNESEIINSLLPAISKLPSKKMTEQGMEIVKYFAPLLESSNPALVNGTKKILSELDPGYLTEHGKGEGIALELQRVAKPKLWQRIVAVFTGTDYAQKNIDKAVANFEKSNSLYIDMKNLSEELQREKQAPNKEINIVTAKKEQGKEQNKTISQSYKSSISTSHVDKLNKTRESGQQQGLGKLII